MIFLLLNLRKYGFTNDFDLFIKINMTNKVFRLLPFKDIATQRCDAAVKIKIYQLCNVFQWGIF